MMMKQYSQSTGLKLLRRTLWIVVLIGLSCFAFGVYLYQDIYDKKTLGFDETADTIISQTAIVEVDEIELYHGEDAYHVVYGKTEDEEERIIFYPLEGAEKNITSVTTAEIVSEKEVLKRWSSDCNACAFVKSGPAIIEDELLWEVTYHDKDDRYTIDYYSIYDGTFYEQYRFRRMFN